MKKNYVNPKSEAYDICIHALMSGAESGNPQPTFHDTRPQSGDVEQYTNRNNGGFGKGLWED